MYRKFNAYSQTFRAIVSVLCILSIILSNTPQALTTIHAQGDEEPKRAQSNRNTQVIVPGPSNVRINTWSGNLFYPVPLLTIPGRGLSIQLSMSYNSSWHDFATHYGQGWQFNYNIYYLRDENGDITIVWGDGSSDRFVEDNGSFLSPVDVHATLQEYQSGKYMLRTKRGIEFYFDSPIHKRLTKIQDPNGNTLTFAYDANMLLTTITDASDRQVNLTYTDGNLISITDPNTTPSRSIQFQYDVDNNLISITDPLGNVTTYGYNAEHYLINIEPPLRVPTTITYADGTVTNVTGELTSRSFSYDTANRITTMTDTAPEGDQTTRFSYDADGRITSIEDPLGSSVSITWDDNNNLTHFTDQNGQVTVYTYDARGNLLTVVDALDNTTGYAYESTYNGLTEVINANSNLTTYQYDTQGNLFNETDPLSNVISYTYNSLGELVSKTDANGTTTYEYNANGYITTIDYPDGSTVSYAYDAVGNMTEMTNADVQVIYTYDALNRVTDVNIASHGKSISYEYDAADNRTRMTDPDGGVTTYGYDGANRLISLTNPLGQVTSYEYDGRGRLIRKDYHNGTYTTYQYDRSNRLLSLVNSKSTSEVISSYAYEYDDAGNRTKMTEANGDETTYRYDDLYRLTSVTYPDGASVEYAYDAVGNRLTLTDTSETTSYSYDEGDRLQSAGSATYSWDNNGNMISKTDESGTTTYAYDYENRLISATFPNGSTNLFTYYPDGRRLSQIDSSGITIHYFYDGFNTLVETNGSGTTIARYTSAGIDDWISKEQSGATNYYHQDGLGSITGLTDASQTIAATYQYDVFGSIKSQTGSIVNSYLFTGRHLDAETGLYYYRVRQYDPSIGRFLQKDPLRFIDGTNLYLYVANNPVNFTDPHGTQTKEDMLPLDKLEEKPLPPGVIVPRPPPITIPGDPIPEVEEKIDEIWDDILGDNGGGHGSGGSPGGGGGGSVGSGGSGGVESGPPRPVSRATFFARAGLQMQPLFTVQDVLPVEGPEGTEPVFVTPERTLVVGNAVEARTVDFRQDPADENTTMAVALVTKTLEETYWHDYSVCTRFHGYTLDALSSISLPGLTEAGSEGQGPWFWYASGHQDDTLEEGLIFAVFVNETEQTFVIDSRWITSEYACHWREPTLQPFDYILNFQIWSSSALETYKLLQGVFEKLTEVGPNWTMTFTNGSEPLNPTVIMGSASLIEDMVYITVQSWLSEPRLVLFHGTKQLCQGCNDIPFEFWEVVNPGLNFIKLPIGNAANAVVFSEADDFLDKVYVDRDEGINSLVIHSIYLPIVVKNPGSPLPSPEPSVDILWPPNGTSVIVEQDLTGEANDYRLTIHGTVQGAQSGWTIFVEVFTDAWYPQELATVQSGLWGARVSLAGKDGFNNHKIRVTLQDESGNAVANAIVNDVVRINPCQAP